MGRFISSTLRHIRASANPDKQLARQHYGLIRTPNKFNVDDRCGILFDIPSIGRDIPFSSKENIIDKTYKIQLWYSISKLRCAQMGSQTGRQNSKKIRRIIYFHLFWSCFKIKLINALTKLERFVFVVFLPGDKFPLVCDQLL